MEHTDTYKMIHKEWKKFIDNEPLSENHDIPTFVLDSWKRCKSKNVSPFIKSVPLPLDKLKVEERLKKNDELIAISRPFLNNLYKFVEGSAFVVALYDNEGYLLHYTGDNDTLEKVKWKDVLIGSCYSEEATGTNGIGTTLIVGEPIQIYACQHYSILFHHFTSSGAPIHDENNEIVGVIDVAGPYQKANPHTLGMVVASAFAIGNEIRLRKALSNLRKAVSKWQIAESFQKTVISSIPESIIAIDNEGLISTMNKNAMNTFGWDNYLGKNILNVWKKYNNSLLKMIIKKDVLTDVEVQISGVKGRGGYTLCCYPILSEGTIIGKIIILNEIKRVKTLVTKIMGAKAKLSFDDIIGQNSKFLETLKHAKIASEIQSNVLLLGESGTGKDIFAQAIHNNSSRREGPYIAINCASIPRDLITSELFGYSEGAFTGSRRGGNCGKFELADGGTIFLDEIGEIPIELQTALLRVLEDKSIFRIGGTRATAIDTRIIAATNRNLMEEVINKKFRQDLYYRLNVFMIQMIPLRERKDDIPILVDYFVRNLNKATRKNIVKTEEEVLDKLCNYSWPGNIRELQNVLERMINIAQYDVITVDLLPPEIAGIQLIKGISHRIKPGNKIDRELIMKMVQSHIPKKEIAKTLGISRTTVYRKLDECNGSKESGQ